MKQKNFFENYIQRLEDKIRGWTEEKVILYGAGEHSRMVLERINWGGIQFLGLSDKSKKRQDEGFLGYPVYAPECISKTGTTKLVISSFSFQEDIYHDLVKRKLPGIEIVKLYTNRDLLTSLKERYAYCPKNGSIRSDLLDSQGKYFIPVEQNRSQKVLLIQPPFSFGNHRHKKILPMNLLYLAGYTLKKNPNAMIRILDGQIHDLTVKEINTLISKTSWDIIGIGYWTPQASTAFELSKYIRRKTKSLLIHGGVHPTLCPDEAVKHCDFVVMGEGEETFGEIVKLFQRKEEIRKIPGVAFENDKSLQINSARPLIKDIDEIPFPAFHLIPDIKIYNASMHVTGGLRVPLIGSRGCPYTCTFCSSPLMWDRKVRWRSPVDIVDEMEEVIRSYGITQFHFWDDNIMLKRGHMKELSEEIIRRNLKVNWCGLTRASHVIDGKELLPRMKESGCVGIEVGIESFTEESTELVRKGEGVHDMRQASQYMKEAGIAPLYTHMLFNPGEHISGYREKQLFLNEINKGNTAYLADSRLGQASTPHRKTPFEKEAKMLGEVFLNDHSTYVHHRINFIPHSLLEDIPKKTDHERKNPLTFLEIILEAIFHWDETMIDQYLEVSDKLWKKIDGKKSIRILSEEIKKEMSLDDYRSKVFACLSIVDLAREGTIVENFNSSIS